MKAACVLALCLALPGVALAHSRSASYSSWRLDGAGARVEVRIALTELSRLDLHPELDAGSGGRAARYLAAHLVLRREGDACTPTTPHARPAPRGWARFAWRVDCPARGTPSIASRILLAQAPGHLHFARVERGAEGALERLLVEGASSWTLRAPAGAEPVEGTSLAGYLALGVGHILSGWDHLAFLVALLLLARRIGEVVQLVTAFTAAHSATLALAVLGVVRPDGASIEALIGFSIALVGAENGWLLGGRGRAVPVAATTGLVALAALAGAGIGLVSAATLVGLALFSAAHFALLDRVARPARLRAAVAFAFGLAHGFGFAGVLADLALPIGRMIPALFGFNAGVELGQLALVALAWPALRAVERASPLRWHRAIAEVGSAAACGVGVYWFVTRALTFP